MFFIYIYNIGVIIDQEDEEQNKMKIMEIEFSKKN